MGYYTTYTLQIRDPKTSKELPREFSEPVISALRVQNAEAAYSLDEGGKDSGNEARWYEHTEEMRQFSKRHPTLLFVLHGEGEESGDIWTEYFLDGI